MQELEGYEDGKRFFLDELFDFLGCEVSHSTADRIFNANGFKETFRGSEEWEKTSDDIIVTYIKNEEIDVTSLSKIVKAIGGNRITMKQIKKVARFHPSMKSVRIGMLRLGWERNEHDACWRYLDEVE